MYNQITASEAQTHIEFLIVKLMAYKRKAIPVYRTFIEVKILFNEV